MSISLKEYFTEWVLYWMSTSLNVYVAEWVLHWMSTSVNEYITDWVLHWMSTCPPRFLWGSDHATCSTLKRKTLKSLGAHNLWIFFQLLHILLVFRVHKGLETELQSLGIERNLLRVVVDYLKERTPSVLINGKFSVVMLLAFVAVKEKGDVISEVKNLSK